MTTKQDGTKARLWSERIAAHAASGLSRRAWCRQADVNPNTMDYWYRRLRGGAPQALVPIVVGAGGATDIELRLPGGVQVRARSGTDAAWLASLVRALAC